MNQGYVDVDAFETYERGDLYTRVTTSPPPESSDDERGYITGSRDPQQVSLNLTHVHLPGDAGYTELIPPRVPAAAAVATAVGHNDNSAGLPPAGPEFGPTWNEEFQRLNSDHSDSVEHWASLAALAHDFVQTAQHYAAIIVSEFHLPDHRKTIKECTAMGGTAGGLKYIASGVLFKFAHDPLIGSGDNAHHLYSGGPLPDTEAAAKALGQELKVRRAIKVSGNSLTGKKTNTGSCRILLERSGSALSSANGRN